MILIPLIEINGIEIFQAKLEMVFFVMREKR